MYEVQCRELIFWSWELKSQLECGENFKELIVKKKFYSLQSEAKCVLDYHITFFFYHLKKPFLVDRQS